ncbi:hypothetical protein LZ30DRAFT_694891 [Colletotrichum cereale]|nr:hypothetical protein LZ30DRAFT_694891 [Colletotrichum cereale]
MTTVQRHVGPFAAECKDAIDGWARIGDIGAKEEGEQGKRRVQRGQDRLPQALDVVAYGRKGEGFGRRLVDGEDENLAIDVGESPKWEVAICFIVVVVAFVDFLLDLVLKVREAIALERLRKGVEAAQCLIERHFCRAARHAAERDLGAAAVVDGLW